MAPAGTEGTVVIATRQLLDAAWDYADPHPGAAQVLRAKLGLPAAG